MLQNVSISLYELFAMLLVAYAIGLASTFRTDTFLSLLSAIVSILRLPRASGTPQSKSLDAETVDLSTGPVEKS